MTPSDFYALVLAPARRTRTEGGGPGVNLDFPNKVLDIFREAGVKGAIFSGPPGTAELPRGPRAFFLAPADYPLVRPWTVDILMREYAVGPPGVLVPTFQGKPGFPRVVDANLADIPGWAEKNISAPGAVKIRAVEVPDRNVLFDAAGPTGLGEYDERLRRVDVPTPEECGIILDTLGPISDEIKKHGRAAAAAALRLGRALIAAGVSLDLEMIEASALLHDLAKGQKNHAEVAGRLLEEKGFPRVAEIVAGHTNFTADESQAVTEAEVVYLADKLVDRDRPVRLEARYLAALERFGADPSAAERIKKRWERAEKARQRLVGVLGRPLEDLVGRLDD
ncbi:MAG: HD domain-containing protein [Pseudomonadota bacterium]